MKAHIGAPCLKGSVHMSQETQSPRRNTRGPVPPRTSSGRVLLTPGAASAALGYSTPHFNRLLRKGKLPLRKHYVVEGGLPRYAEDEIEALKK
jgi:hypothetical protein